jgi:hypothetical protein
MHVTSEKLRITNGKEKWLNRKKTASIFIVYRTVALGIYLGGKIRVMNIYKKSLTVCKMYAGI